MVTIRPEISGDITAREALLDRAFGRGRQRKTSQRLRDDRLPAEGLAFTALSKSGRVIGTLRMWNVIAGSAGPALLLGPLAVDTRHQRRGTGRELMNHALNMAKVLGYASVLLVGDESYYSHFGFGRSLVADLHLPGPVERNRFLGLELTPNALDGAEASGSIRARFAAPGRAGGCMNPSPIDSTTSSKRAPANCALAIRSISPPTSVRSFPKFSCSASRNLWSKGALKVRSVGNPTARCPVVASTFLLRCSLASHRR